MIIKFQLACAVRFSDRTPRQRPRLEEIRSNLKDRIIEAELQDGEAKPKDSKSASPASPDKLDPSTPAPAALSTSEPPPYQRIRDHY